MTIHSSKLVPEETVMRLFSNRMFDYKTGGSLDSETQAAIVRGLQGAGPGTLKHVHNGKYLIAATNLKDFNPEERVMQIKETSQAIPSSRPVQSLSLAYRGMAISGIMDKKMLIATAAPDKLLEKSNIRDPADILSFIVAHEATHIGVNKKSTMLNMFSGRFPIVEKVYEEIDRKRGEGSEVASYVEPLLDLELYKEKGYKPEQALDEIICNTAGLRSIKPEAELWQQVPHLMHVVDLLDQVGTPELLSALRPKNLEIPPPHKRGFIVATLDENERPKQVLSQIGKHTRDAIESRGQDEYLHR